MGTVEEFPKRNKRKPKTKRGPDYATRKHYERMILQLDGPASTALLIGLEFKTWMMICEHVFKWWSQSEQLIKHTDPPDTLP